MRIAVLAIVLAAFVAGCTSPSDEQPLTGDDAEKNRADELARFLQDHPTFCDAESSCDFWDDDYHQYVVYDLDTTQFDVVIVPPAGVSTPDNIAASRQAVQAWGDGILELAQPWLRDNFTMTVSAVGVDVPDLASVQDPEIVVISSSAEFLVGIGLEPKQLGCMILDELTLREYEPHIHGDVAVYASDCTGTGFTCFALNVGAPEPRGLYDLIAHEVGHCLGAGHVGDAGDFRARYAPVEDIMSYQDNPEQVHCVSTMNVRNLEGVYGHLHDRPEDELLPRGSFLPFNPLDWATVECENPPGM